MTSGCTLRSVKENQPTKEGSEPAGKKKAIWSPEDDKALLYCLLEQQAAGNQGDNGWKKVVWTAAEEALKDSGGKGGYKTWTSCRDHFKALKDTYVTVKGLLELSGFGWDESRHLVTASDDVWDRYLKAHAEASKWHTKTFLCYQLMAGLVDGRHATGENAISISIGDSSDVASADSLQSLILEDDCDTSDEHAPELTSSPSSSPPPLLPSSQRRKRAASVDDVADPTLVKSKKGRTSGPDALLALAGAVGQVANASLAGGQPAAHLSGTHLVNVVAVLSQDPELTIEDQGKALVLFCMDPFSADTYLEIKDDGLRHAYILAELASL